MWWVRCLIALSLVLLQSAARAEGLELVWAPPAVPVRSYVIERRLELSEQEFVAIVHAGSSAVRFVDESVTPGLRYCYRVRVIRSDGSSSSSAALCAKAEQRSEPRSRTLAAEAAAVKHTAPPAHGQ